MANPQTPQAAAYAQRQAASAAAVQRSFEKFQARESVGGGFSSTAKDRWLLQNYEFNHGLR